MCCYSWFCEQTFLLRQKNLVNFNFNKQIIRFLHSYLKNYQVSADPSTVSSVHILERLPLLKSFSNTFGSLNIAYSIFFQIYYQDNFYVEYGADSRYLYNLPHLVMYCLQHQIVMTLCSSICTEVGFGVYPAKCIPLPGHGPSARLSLLKLALVL